MNASQLDWRLVAVVALGTTYGIESSIHVIARGLVLKGLAGLSLVYLFTPLLLSRRLWLFRIAYTFCIFEVLKSGLMFFGSFVSAIDPISFTVRVFTLKILYLDTVGSQFLYFAARAAVFIGALVVLVGSNKNRPNKAPEPTITSVTDRAAHAPRQP